jgi:hypothetical protein
MVWLSLGLGLEAGTGISGMSLGQLVGSVKAQAVLLSCGYAASLAVGLLLVRLVAMSAPEAGLTMGRRSVGAGFIGFVCAWPLVMTVSAVAVWSHTVATGAKPDPIAHETLQTLADHPESVWAWLLTALAVLAAPVQEEIVYRGFAQSAVLAATQRPWLAVLATSTIFTAAHVVGDKPVPWYAGVAIFALSVCMGVAFERSRSLLVPIIMHVLFNAANVAMVAWG